MTTLPAETALSSPTQYEDAVRQAREAAAAYYGDGESPLDDASYDQLLRAIEVWEKDHPEHVAADSPTGQVGAGAAPVGDIAHTTRLLSLANVFNPAELLSWGASVDRRLGRPASGGWAVEVKLDGNAIVGRYTEGRLTQVIQRGNGTHGEDISHIIGTIDGLPVQLPQPLTFEVRGEILFTNEQFERANEVRIAHGAGVFANARNGIAGTVRAKDRPYTLRATFFAYGAVDLPGVTFLPQDATHAEVLQAVADAGVQTVANTPTGVRVVATLAEAQQLVDEIAARRATLPFEIDGVVIKCNDAAEQAAAGVGSRFPHWAIAFKLPPTSRMTVLTSVTWEVGRTGVIAPTAVLDPVEVAGSVVSRATLHNPRDIRRRDLHLGDTVTVHKAGDVIPRVEAPIVVLRPTGAQPVPLPEVCPNCGDAIDKSQERWRCVKGSACRLPALIEYAAGRDQLDIDGLGEKYVQALVDSGAVSDVADLFYLTVEQLTAASGSAKRGAKLAEQIEAAKSRPLNRFFCALGLPGTGRTMSRRIAAQFRTMDDIRSADAEALRWVEGIGPEKAPVIVQHLADQAPVIDKLVKAGIELTEPEPEAASAGPSPLAGKTVVVTGKMTDALDGYGRHEMNVLIEKAGGRAGSSVNSKTDYLVAAETNGKPSTKAVKAASLGVTVLTPNAFADLVADFIG
ncbi:NAD-dependent DNA ligase LigA [Streptomyces sp. NPDC002817]|uniref:NAD-dependent DNA ligase LigA n=1 Tax=Streptomyces sp. NPDC088357 TaxID=3154655 RepID=UPI0034442F86